MKETPAQFQARVVKTYAPPPWLLGLGTPLAPDTPCPTLFRYPGPEGILSSLQGSCARLAPGELPYTWLSSAPIPPVPGASLFGAIAILQPLRLHPCRAPERDAWLAVNAVLEADCPALWIPPTDVSRSMNWDAITTADELVSSYGASYGSARDAAAELVAGYLEEVDAVTQAGGSAGSVWCERTADERRRILAECGLRGRFTR